MGLKIQGARKSKKKKNNRILGNIEIASREQQKTNLGSREQFFKGVGSGQPPCRGSL